MSRIGKFKWDFWPLESPNFGTRALEQAENTCFDFRVDQRDEFTEKRGSQLQNQKFKSLFG